MIVKFFAGTVGAEAGAIITPTGEGFPLSEYACILLPGESETLRWPTYAGEEHIYVVISSHGDTVTVSCLSERISADQILASAQFQPGRTTDQIDWVASEEGFAGHIARQLVLGVAQVRGFADASVEPPDEDGLDEDGVNGGKIDAVPDYAPSGFWQVSVQGNDWFLFETGKLLDGDDPQAQVRGFVGIVVESKSIQATGITDLRFAASGQVIWSESTGMLYWPKGSHPGLDAPLRVDELPAAVSLFARQI